jgi:hypothetical protein
LNWVPFVVQCRSSDGRRPGRSGYRSSPGVLMDLAVHHRYDPRYAWFPAIKSQPQQHDDDGLSRSEIRPHKQCTACIQIKQTGQPRYVAPPLFFPAAARQQKPPSLRRHDLPGSAKISQQPLVAAYLRVTPRLKAWVPLNFKRNLESYVAVNFEKIQSSDQNSRV